MSDWFSFGLLRAWTFFSQVKTGLIHIYLLVVSMLRYRNIFQYLKLKITIMARSEFYYTIFEKQNLSTICHLLFVCLLMQ